MNKRKKLSELTKEDIRKDIVNEKKTYEIEIEKNFFVKTTDPERSRLEKWKIGRRNFS